MRQYIQIFFFSALMAGIICGCAPAQPQISADLNNSFGKIIAMDDMNKYFQVRVDSSNQENMKFGSDTMITLTNLSDQKILFQVGYGIRMFVARDNNWIEVQNNAVYYGDEVIMQPKTSQMSEKYIVTGIQPIFSPEIKDEGHQEALRIVIIGELSNGEKPGIPVGAYTDVFVTP